MNTRSTIPPALTDAHFGARPTSLTMPPEPGAALAVCHDAIVGGDGRRGNRVFSLRRSAGLVALVLASLMCLHDIAAFAQSDDATFDKQTYEVTFHANGTFVAKCRCVSIVTYCSKFLRAIGAAKTGDRRFGIEEWDLYGTMKSGAQFDLRQACYFDDKRQDVQFCCTKGTELDFSADKEFYAAELESTRSE